MPAESAKQVDAPLPTPHPLGVPAPSIEGPEGTWERKVEASHIVLHIDADHISGTLKTDGEKKSESFTITIDADYSVTKDQILYGVITGIDYVPLDTASEEDGPEMLLDYTFSVRYRVDGEVLTIKDFKIGLPDDKGIRKETRMFIGPFKKKIDGDKEPQKARKITSY